MIQKETENAVKTGEDGQIGNPQAKKTQPGFKENVLSYPLAFDRTHVNVTSKWLNKKPTFVALQHDAPTLHHQPRWLRPVIGDLKLFRLKRVLWSIFWTLLLYSPSLKIALNSLP